MAVDPFSSIPAALRSAMTDRGFTELTAVQQAVVEARGEPKDLRISSQTGSGKTVALGIVLADHFLSRPRASGRGDRAPRSGKRPIPPEALVITPTRELAAQVRQELAWLYRDLPGVSVAVVTGGTAVVGERRELARSPRLVVGTPGRLLDHLRSGALDPSHVAHVVLDEADQMLDLGFKDELDAIVDELPAERRSHLVSATFPPQVRHLADRFQADPLHLQGTELGAANEDITHVAHVVRPGEAYAALVNLLLLAHGQRCLVFVRRRVDATDLAEMLGGDGFCAMPLSGDMAQAQRTRTLNAFRSGTVNVLISTDVAARGIDVPDITTVIHAEPPTDADVYTHRSGRTGRAGRKGRSVMLVPAPAERRIRRLLASARVDAQWQPVPNPSKVRKALTKHARRRLHQLLDAEQQPSEAEIAYARELLGSHSPEHLVATLLAMSEPEVPREPMAVSEVPKAEPARASRKPRGFVRFHITWGQRSGATPARLLSHVCRRGGISGQSIGAIKIEPRSAAFEVDEQVAAEFEERAKKRDPREPGLKISRFRPSQRR